MPFEERDGINVTRQQSSQGVRFLLRLTRPPFMIPTFPLQSGKDRDVDVLLVGAGPTGLTAAGEALRCGLSA